MKRRELIEQLTEYVHRYDGYVTTNKHQCEHLVDLIITKAENLGILFLNKWEEDNEKHEII